jgi:CubicO group peptidase (beta-lactamase class C family)
MLRAVFFLSVAFLLSSCLKEEELKKPFATYTPRQINDGWELSTPEAENMDHQVLKEIYRDFHANQDIWQVRSLLVFRNRKLVAESYTKDDDDISTPRAIWSCTKQVVGLLTGIALEKHIIGSVHDSIANYLPETGQNPDKKNILVEHLLTMNSGINYSNDGLSGQTDDILRQLPSSISGFILGRPVKSSPGTEFQYKDCDPQLVSAIIQNKCGTSTAHWAKDVLFDPLGIRYLQWNNYKDGVTLGGFGILTTPREMAKFGQLILDNGVWKGNRLVSKEWIKEMTTIRAENIYGCQFGYLMWIDKSRDMVFMWGHGGQFVFILPAKNLVIVMTAEVNTQDDFQFSTPFEWVDRIVKISY